ncbi:MAG: hypothetical protein WBS54_07260 [Acidobacteriota bacterium]
MIGSPAIFVAVVTVVWAAGIWLWRRRDPDAPKRRFFRPSRCLALAALLLLSVLLLFERGLSPAAGWALRFVVVALLIAASIAEWVYNLRLKRRPSSSPT